MPRITLTDNESHVVVIALDERFKQLTTRLNTYERYIENSVPEDKDYDDVSRQARDIINQLARTAIILDKLRKGTV